MKLTTILLALVFTTSVACGDDNDNATGAETPDVTASVRTPAPTPQAASTRPASGVTVEVQGIVGAIDERSGTIEINRLQGADVGMIRVDPATRITSARGGTLRLSDLRPSDRIIATGAIDGGVLVATEIEVGQVVPGGAPGG